MSLEVVSANDFKRQKQGVLEAAGRIKEVQRKDLRLYKIFTRMADRELSDWISNYRGDIRRALDELSRRCLEPVRMPQRRCLFDRFLINHIIEVHLAQISKRLFVQIDEYDAPDVENLREDLYYIGEIPILDCMLAGFDFPEFLWLGKKLEDLHRVVEFFKYIVELFARGELESSVAKSQINEVWKALGNSQGLTFASGLLKQTRHKDKKTRLDRKFEICEEYLLFAKEFFVVLSQALARYHDGRTDIQTFIQNRSPSTLLRPDYWLTLITELTQFNFQTPYANELPFEVTGKIYTFLAKKLENDKQNLTLEELGIIMQALVEAFGQFKEFGKNLQLPGHDLEAIKPHYTRAEELLENGLVLPNKS